MIAIFFFITFALSVFASTDTGGSAAVVCYREEKIVSAELLDLYEARARGLKLKTGSTLRQISKKIFKSDDYAWEVGTVKKMFFNIPADSELELHNENYPVFLPRGCRVQQLTVFHNRSTIWLDKTLYDQLEELSKLALIFHEYIYLKERARGSNDSRYTRRIVGLAFSTEDPFESEDEIGNDFNGVHCNSADLKTAFMATKIDALKNIWAFYFLELNGHKIFSRKSAEFSLVQDLSRPFVKLKSTGQNLSTTKTLQSKINPNETLLVTSTSNSLHLSWKGTDPKDEFNDVEFRCGFESDF